MRVWFIFSSIILFLSACQKGDETRTAGTVHDLSLALEQAEISAPNAEYVMPMMMEIAGERYWGIFQHAPSLIEYSDVYVGPNATFCFGIGMDPGSWESEGDGVSFDIIKIPEKGRWETIYSRQLNPIRNPDERRWIFDSAPVGNVEAATYSFLLRVSAGENGDKAFDQAMWARPQIQSEGWKIGMPESEKPNVVLITLDTVRADYMGAYGNSWIQTPWFDQLAKEGVLFEHAYTPMATTTPAHASILTGILPYAHGCIANDYHLAGAVPQLPQLFKQNGYYTGAAVSAYHLNGKVSGLGKWFDRYEEVNMGWQAMGIRDTYTLTRDAEVTTNAAVSIMESAQDDPFFVWIHYYDAHSPYQAIGDYHKKYYPGDPAGGPSFMESVLFHRVWNEDFVHWMRPYHDIDYFRKEYGAEISYVDSFLGQIKEALKRLRIDENTLILIAADHGENLGDHGIVFDHWTMYNSDIHVPMIFWWPGRIPQGMRIAEPVSLVDLAPTVLDLVLEDETGVEAVMDGISLAPYWSDASERERDRILVSQGLLYTQIAGFDDRCKVVWELRRFMYHEAMQLHTDRVWLYDVQADPNEEYPVGSFYWGERSGDEDPWKDERHAPPLQVDGVTLELFMQQTRERAGTKYVPSVEALQGILGKNDGIDFIQPAYADDRAYLERVVRILQRLKDEVNPVSLKDRLGYYASKNGLILEDLESIRVDDRAYLESQEALGYFR